MAGVQASALLGSFLAEHEASIVKRAVRDLKWSLQAELPAGRALADRRVLRGLAGLVPARAR
ncbi:MAG: hypothetical protein QM765_01745 [Myxococcales bacterium]